MLTGRAAGEDQRLVRRLDGSFAIGCLSELNLVQVGGHSISAVAPLEQEAISSYDSLYIYIYIYI